MAETDPLHLPEPQRGAGHTAVIDIGSNSVRMVVFAGSGRMPVPVFNERTFCGLGRDLGETGSLNPEGRKLALDHLARFADLGAGMNIVRWEVLATDAVRRAGDGPEFVIQAERLLGVPVQILSSEDEAEASALGVVSGIPKADGLMGDLGGGSLEIVALDSGVPGRRATLPLGSLRLGGKGGKLGAKILKRIDAAFETVPWLDAMAGRTFYPVGGAWRAFASVHMGYEGYPLHVVHGYALARRNAEKLLELVSGLSPSSLAEIPGVPRARLETLPAAAHVMRRLLKLAKPRDVVFSAQGLREGWLYSQLSEQERRLDPLLAGCEEVAGRWSRFGLQHGDELIQWVAPLFKGDSAERIRLFRAAALLSDTGWRYHPDYRDLDAFRQVLHMPLIGIDHRERVMLAFLVSARYGGGLSGGERESVVSLIDEGALDWAMRAGRALRLALTLSGGIREVLLSTRLRMTKKYLTLTLPKGAGYLLSDVTARRFEALAERLGRSPRVEC